MARGIEIRGHAETSEAPTPVIRIHAERIVSWGLVSNVIGDVDARTVEPQP